MRTTVRSAVIFDLGGVVFDSPLYVLRGLERDAGLPLLTLGHVIQRTGRDGAWARLERGEIGVAEFTPRLQAEFDAAAVPLRVSEMMQAMARALRVRPRMLAAVRSLRAGGFKTAALTNNWRGAATDPFAPLEPEFDAFVQSCRVGRRKPEPEIYAIACEALAVTPHEAVFLDDIGANLKPARALGMATIKVDDPDVALAELEAVLAPAWRAPRECGPGRHPPSGERAPPAGLASGREPAPDDDPS